MLVRRLLLSPDAPAEGAPTADDLSRQIGAALDSDPTFARGTEGTTVSAADPEPEADEGGDPAAPPPPADPNLAANVRPRQQQAPSVRDFARQYGYDFGGEVADDQAALAQLVREAQQARQANYYADLGRQIVPYAPQIQTFLQQQQQQPAAQLSEWDRPQIDPKWLNLVKFDEDTGVYLPQPGAPPEIAQKVNAYADWHQRYQREPERFIQHQAEQVFGRMFEQAFQSYTARQAEAQAVQEVQQRHAGWLYAKDAQGNAVVDRSGRYALSPAGQRYAQLVQQVSQQGVRDVRAQDRLALALLRDEIAQAQQQGQQRQRQRQTPQTQAAQRRPNQNPLGALAPTERQVRQAPEPTTTGRSLMDMMRAAVDQEGFGDDDFDMLRDQT